MKCIYKCATTLKTKFEHRAMRMRNLNTLGNQLSYFMNDMRDCIYTDPFIKLCLLKV